MSELLVAIALWCGQPINGTGYHPYQKLTMIQIQKCRADILKCQSDKKEARVKCFTTDMYKDD